MPTKPDPRGFRRNWGHCRGPLGIRTNFTTYGSTRAKHSYLYFSRRVDLKYRELLAKGLPEDLIKDILKKGEASAYKFLSRMWRIYWRKSDCKALCFYVARRIRNRMKLRTKIHYNPIKMYKNDKKWIKGVEHVEARQRYKVRVRDKLSDYLSVYEGPGASYAQENFTEYRLHAGMCVYTAEGCQKEKGKWRWSRRHMRMYIGKGEFRDSQDTYSSRRGGPVYSSKRSLYVVLGVWDPFRNARKGLQW